MTIGTEAQREPQSNQTADTRRARTGVRPLKLTFGINDPEHRTFDWGHDGLREFADHRIAALSMCASIGDPAARYVTTYGGYRYLHFTVSINANTRILEDTWHSADLDDQHIEGRGRVWEIVSLQHWTSGVPAARYLVQMESLD